MEKPWITRVKPLQFQPEPFPHFKVCYQFSGKIPTSLSNLTKLEVLQLQNNFLEGEIPREISDLRYLTVLDLQFNQLNGSVGNFSNAL